MFIAKWRTSIILKSRPVSRRHWRGQRGFSLIEALIGAALISITALGLGSSIRHLMQSRERSQAVSLAVQTESSLVNAIQDPASYSSIADILKSGKTPPSSFSLGVAVDPANGKSFNISPGQQVYLDNNLQSCGGFSDKNCTLMVALSPWGKDIPIPGQYSFAYSIQANPAVSSMPALGSSSSTFQHSDYMLTVPNLTNTGKVVQCPANSVGILGVDAAGQAICLYYPDNTASCKADEIPKGFQVTPDATDTHRYYLSFKCVAIRKISCASPDYSFESFNPVALDPASANGTYPVGKCVYIGAPTSNPISATGTNGMQVYQLCAPNYGPTSVSCNLAGAPSPVNVTCSDGHVLVANTSGITTQMSNDGTVITCQAVIPPQQCCSDDPTKCTQVNVPISTGYTCSLDSAHGDQWIY